MKRRPRQAGLVLFAVTIGALLLQAACRETPIVAPGGAPIVPDGRFHQVQWSATTSKGFGFASAGRAAQASRGAGASASSSVQSGNEATFWAYTNRDVTFTASVLADDGTWQPYVKLFVPRGSLLQRPDGSPFTSQDSIEISVSLDPATLRVTFGPDGLQFNPQVAAQLTISYDGAAADLNGDGLVNSVDEYIAQVLLGLRVRQHESDPWSVLPSINDVLGRSLSADVRHFSGYAVSW